MADLCAIYSLSTPAGTLTINDTSITDCFIIDSEGQIEGLDDPEVRNVFKPRPQTDGAYVGPGFLSGFRITFNGLAIVRSADPYGDSAGYRTAMRALESDMRTKLRSLLQSDGTLQWEGNTLSNIRYDSRVEFGGTMLKHRFVFGISSPNADWT